MMTGVVHEYSKARADNFILKTASSKRFRFYDSTLSLWMVNERRRDDDEMTFILRIRSYVYCIFIYAMEKKISGKLSHTSTLALNLKRG